jgi:hypothetical protein
VLLDSTTHLPDGARVRVRLPHVTDRPAMHALHARLGLRADDLELARALRFDPRRRAVVCATVWVGAAETLAAYAAMDLAARRLELLVADEELAPGVRDVLMAVLTEHAAGRDAA